MKNRLFFAGMVGMVLAFGLVLGGCGDGADNSGSSSGGTQPTRISAPKNFRITSKTQSYIPGYYDVTLQWDTVSDAYYYSVGYADTIWSYEYSYTGRFTFETVPSGRYDFSVEAYRKTPYAAYDPDIDVSTKAVLNNISVP